MKRLLLNAIGVYQRFISPYKGFRCAYCAFTGRASCSALGLRAIRRFGAVDGLGVLRERLFRCGVAYRRYKPAVAPAPVNYQRGACDLPCELPCDFSGDSAGPSKADACDCASAFDCGWPDKKREEEAESEVHIPPRRSAGAA